MNQQTRKTIEAVDLSKRPRLYRTNNPKHYGRICIDFEPDTLPTIASFETEKDAEAWLVEAFGIKQVNKWFPFAVPANSN